MAKKGRENIRMQSTGVLTSGKRSPYYKTQTKNKKVETDKRKRMMYDPFIRKHVLFEEMKLAKAS